MHKYKQEPIVVTGLGTLSPLGIGKKLTWDNACKNQSCLNAAASIEFENFNISDLYVLPDFDLTAYIPARLIEKLDPFTQYALVASELALQDAQLNLEKINKTDVGVYLANSCGGWQFTERELRNLYTKGIESVSPFLATAWFPAAPQGQITIQYGIKGQSKTFDADFAGGICSIGYAVEAIKAGCARYILAGATEAAITPFMLSALLSRGQADSTCALTTNGNFLPYTADTTGYKLGEGATLLLLESASSARSRNANIYGEITGFCLQNAACHPKFSLNADALCLAIMGALEQARLKVEDISLIIPHALGTLKADRHELDAIQQVFGSGNKVILTAPKTMIGHLGAATGAMDVAFACMCLEQQEILPTLASDGLILPDCYELVQAKETTTLNHILVLGRGMGGLAAAMIISKYKI